MSSRENPKKRKRARARARALPARNAFAYTIPDAQAMGAPSKTTIYQLVKAGRLKFVEAPGCSRMLEGDSLRSLLGADEQVA